MLWIQLLLLGLLCRLLYAVAYRMWLSPVAKFPGPKMAALTFWYEFYYDLLREGGGLYIWEVEKMHKTYGPIVRVNPYELHVNDPDFFDEIYAGVNRPRNKYEWHAQGTTSPSSFAFTLHHKQHRMRREPLQPFFSRRSILSLEPLITAKVDRLSERLTEYYQAKRPINLSTAFVALTVDIISQCCYADSFDYLEVDDFAPAWRMTVIQRMKSMKLVSHFPQILLLLKWLPHQIVAALFGDVSMAGQHKQRIRVQVERLLAHNSSLASVKHRTVFKELLESKSLPPEEKSIERLTDEGAVLLGAGSETVAKTLGIITLHLMLAKGKLDRLRSELRDKQPNSGTRLSWTELEKLPYMTAVIKEGLRLHHGLTARNPRVAPNEDLRYKQWVIPAGTPVSSIQALIHLNPEIFPEPRAFLPERWLLDGGKSSKSTRYMFSFGRGSRSCLGISLAYAELYLTLAILVPRFDFVPFDTGVEDVDLERDFTIPTPRLGSLGVRATVSRILTD